jgi:sigma-B regulation protein RsbU (phosphoserine phosphatase)
MEDVAKLAAPAILQESSGLPPAMRSSGSVDAQSLALLYEVSRELTSILDRDHLFRSIAQSVKKLVDYHVFTVMLWNDAAQHLEGVFAMHFENSIPARYRVPLNRGITGSAAAERRSLLVGDVRNDPRYISCDVGVNVRSELVVPLLLQDRLIGVLDLESTEPHAFTAEQEMLLSTLSSYVAIALENARLYEESRRNELRLQNELDTAREIQCQLLPKGAREIPGLDLAASYLPALEVGGDFYDLLPYGEGRLALALGDVSGKGTAAALFGSLTIGMLREQVMERRSPPDEMLARLNRGLHATRLDARFVAMLFAVYDAGTRHLTMASAGGPYPLLVRDSKVREIRVQGVPLGLLPDSSYESVSLELEPGDYVLFASDGILESLDAHQEEFGAERLSALLSSLQSGASAHQVATDVLAATDLHAGPGVRPHDDRTLLVLRIQASSATADWTKMPVIY